jgi:rubrerythrin
MRPPSNPVVRRRRPTLPPELSRVLDELTLAEDIELLAGRLYTALARRFADDAEAHALFERLAAEEHEHALRIGLLATNYAQDPKRFGAVRLDAERLTALKREGEALLRIIERSGAPLSLDQAMRLAARLERKFAGAHAEQAAAQSDPDMRDFFVLFVAQDRAHARLLGH